MDKNPNDFPKDVNKKTTKSKKQQIRPPPILRQSAPFPEPNCIRQQPANPYPKNA